MLQTAANMDEPRPPLHILVAEDSPSIQYLIVATLQMAGHAVTVANNGLEAVEAFEMAGRRGSGSFFDAVLMDLSMPGMDGLTAARVIRDRDRAMGGRLRIIALTAFATPEYRAKCREAGMDTFLSKPFDLDDVNRALTPGDDPAQDAQAEDNPPPTVESGRNVGAPTADEKAASSAPVDLNDALEVAGGDVDILRAAVAVALEEMAQQLQELKAGMAGQDLRIVGAKAHRLKGMLANIGASFARELAQRLETLSEQGHLNAGPAVLHSLEAEIEQVARFYGNPGWEQRARACLEVNHG